MESDQGVSKGMICQHRDGALIGYLVLYSVLDEGHILNLAVSPDWRNKGVASYLLQRFEEEMMTQGVGFLFLEVRSQNVEARTLYDRFGYEMIGKRKRYYRDDDALVMIKELKGVT